MTVAIREIGCHDDCDNRSEQCRRKRPIENEYRASVRAKALLMAVAKGDGPLLEDLTHSMAN